MKQFLQNCSAVISREPKVFWEAVLATCSIKESGGRPVVVLRKPKVSTVKFALSWIKLSRECWCHVLPSQIRKGTVDRPSQLVLTFCTIAVNMPVSGQSRMQPKGKMRPHGCRQQQSQASLGTRTSLHTRTGMATMPMVPVRALSCPQLLPAAALLAWQRPQGAARAPAARLQGHLHRARGQTGGTAQTGGALQVTFDKEVLMVPARLHAQPPFTAAHTCIVS